MPVTLNRLNAKQVRDPLPKGVYPDGGGLTLHVTEKGAKSWRFTYRWSGKRPELGFGSYPVVTLAEARRRADMARQALASKPPQDHLLKLIKQQGWLENGEQISQRSLAPKDLEHFRAALVMAEQFLKWELGFEDEYGAH